MNFLDDKIKKIVNEKRELSLSNHKRFVSDDDYEERITALNEELRELNKEKMKEIIKRNEEREISINETLKETEKKVYMIKKGKKGKKGKKKNDVSYTDLILQALEHPKANNEDKVVILVNEWKPGQPEQNLRRQIKNIISIIKNKDKKQYSEYNWVEGEYKIVKSKQLTL